MSANSLDGRVAVVTGAARGIGKAVALRLARDGCQVVLSGRNREPLEEAAAEIRKAGSRAALCAADIRRRETPELLIQTAQDNFGRLDILVNSAGIAKLVPFVDLELETWQEFQDLHLTATFRCGQAAARAMIGAGSGGRIVNISSIAASMAMYGQAAYAAAKAGVSALTRVMAIELAPHAITVNALAPGPIGTEQLRAVYDEAMYRERSRSIPLTRLGEPPEVADMVAFLVSDEAAYVTGQIFTLDGGASAVGCYSYETYKRQAPARS